VSADWGLPGEVGNLSGAHTRRVPYRRFKMFRKCLENVAGNYKHSPRSVVNASRLQEVLEKLI
jgi:hypothetical protein